jgi:hypothetical protein
LPRWSSCAALKPHPTHAALAAERSKLPIWNFKSRLIQPYLEVWMRNGHKRASPLSQCLPVELGGTEFSN